MVGMDNTGTWHWLSNDGNGGTGTLDDLYVLWKSGSTVSNGVAWKEGSGDITSVPDMFECYEEEDAPDTAPAKKAPAETEPATKRPVETPSKPDGNEDFSALKTPSNPSSVAYEIPRLEEQEGGGNQAADYDSDCSSSHTDEDRNAPVEDWRITYRRLEQENRQFVDAEFPCDATAIVGAACENKAVLDALENDVQWLRMEEIVENVFFMKFSWLHEKSGILGSLTRKDSNTRISGISMLTAQEVEMKKRAFKVDESWAEERYKYLDTAKALTLTGMSENYADLSLLCQPKLGEWLQSTVTNERGESVTRAAAFFEGIKRRAVPAIFEGGVGISYFYTEFPFSAANDMATAAANANGVNIPTIAETAVVNVIVSINFTEGPRCLFSSQTKQSRKPASLSHQQFDNSSLFDALGIFSSATGLNHAEDLFPALGNRPDAGNGGYRSEQDTSGPVELARMQQRLNKVGLYAVEFFWKGKKRLVVVDDLIPCDAAGIPMFSRSLKTVTKEETEQIVQNKVQKEKIREKVRRLSSPTVSDPKRAATPEVVGESMEHSFVFLNGPMGMVLGDGVEIDATGHDAPYVELVKVLKDSQAEGMEGLKRGFRMVRIGKTSVVGATFDRVMELLKESSRPIEVVFVAKPAMRKHRSRSNSLSFSPGKEPPPDHAKPSLTKENDQVQALTPPTDTGSTPAMEHRLENNTLELPPTEYWPLIVQKAYAKLHGSYHAVTHIHDICGSLMHISGGVTTKFTWDLKGNAPYSNGSKQRRGYRDGMLEWTSSDNAEGAKTLFRRLRSIAIGEENNETLFCARVRKQTDTDDLYGYEYGSDGEEIATEDQEKTPDEQDLLSSSGHAIFIVCGILSSEAAVVDWYQNESTGSPVKNGSKGDEDEMVAPKICLYRPWDKLNTFGNQKKNGGNAPDTPAAKAPSTDGPGETKEGSAASLAPSKIRNPFADSTPPLAPILRNDKVGNPFVNPGETGTCDDDGLPTSGRGNPFTIGNSFTAGKSPKIPPPTSGNPFTNREFTDGKNEAKASKRQAKSGTETPSKGHYITMGIDEFYEKFDSIMACHPLNNYPWVSRINVQGYWKAGLCPGITSLKHPQYRLKVPLSCQAVISIEKQSPGTPNDQAGPTTIGVLVEKPLEELHDDEIGKARLQVGMPGNRLENGFRTCRTGNCFVSVTLQSTRICTEPYVVIPLTIVQNDPIEVTKFSLTVHTTKGGVNIVPPELNGGVAQSGYRYRLFHKGSVGQDAGRGRRKIPGGGSYPTHPTWWKNPQYIFNVVGNENDTGSDVYPCTIVLNNLTPLTTRRVREYGNSAEAGTPPPKKGATGSSSEGTKLTSFNRGWDRIGFLVAHCDHGHEIHSLTKMTFVGNCPLSKLPTVVETMLLPKGQYIVIPYGESPDVLFRYRLTIFSDSLVDSLRFAPKWKAHITLLGEWRPSYAGGCSNNRDTWLENPVAVFHVGDDTFTNPFVIDDSIQKTDSGRELPESHPVVFVSSIDENSQASLHKSLRVGDIVESVGKVSVANQPFAAVMSAIRQSQRPVDVTFRSPTLSRHSNAGAEGKAVEQKSYTFGEGSMGMVLSNVDIGKFLQYRQELEGLEELLPGDSGGGDENSTVGAAFAGENSDDEMEQFKVKVKILQLLEDGTGQVTEQAKRVHPGFLLYRGLPPFRYSKGSVVGGKHWIQDEFNGVLEPGVYTIVPQTYNPGMFANFAVHLCSEVELIPYVLSTQDEEGTKWLTGAEARGFRW